ncbi:hypothetical protein [Erythrobacter alti]|uniref:hypothetical protein n=1 Tax=Erythrobacter alti TaxID=1896145 RepID=UPI0030F3FB09
MADTGAGGTDRRGAIRLALAAAIAPCLTWRQANAQAVSGGLINPPPRPMVYHREVTRDLVDGSAFSVSRCFSVEFRRFSRGFMLHGQQSEVAVDAPQQLASFAEMERGRDESGMFPLALDPFGLILSSESHSAERPSVQEALEQTIAALNSQHLSQGERVSLETFVGALHATGQRIIAHMPIDLFSPAGAERLEEQEIALPDGGRGRVVTRFHGERDSATGLMRSATRQIITEVENSRRITSESWNLAPA